MVTYKNGVYTVDGIGERPRVSSVLDVYFPPSTFYTEEGSERGTNRHAWYHALVSGKKIKNDPDPAISAEVEGFKKFLAEVKPLYVFGEEPLYDSQLQVCGTPDFYGKINGRYCVVDFKPATAHPRWRLQTAAYTRMLRVSEHPVIDRYVLRMTAGGYRLDKHDDAQDLTNWEVMVRAYYARRHYGE